MNAVLADAIHMQYGFLICFRDWKTPFFWKKGGEWGKRNLTI